MKDQPDNIQDTENQPSVSPESRDNDYQASQPEQPTSTDRMLDQMDREPDSRPGGTPPTATNNDLAVRAEQEPAAAPSQATSGQAAATPKGRQSSKPVILAVLAAALVLLGGSAVAAYSLWYQNPQKVVTDALVNAVKAETMAFDGTIDITNRDEYAGFDSVKISLDSQSRRLAGYLRAEMIVKAEGNDYRLEGAAHIDDQSNLYFKASNVMQTLEDWAAASSGEEDVSLRETAPESVINLIDKIDDKWIRIGADELAEMDQDFVKQRECLNDAFSKFENDQQAQQQLVDAYQNNQFIVIKEELGTRDGNLGYAIGGDRDKAEAFVEALKTTSIYQQVIDCDAGISIEPDDIDASADSDTDARLELWISQFGHELRQVKASLTNDQAEGTVEFNTWFNREVSVDAPAEYISFTELMQDIDAVMDDMMGVSGGTSDDSLQPEFEGAMSGQENFVVESRT